MSGAVISGAALEDGPSLGGDKPLHPAQERFITSPATRKVYLGQLGSGKTEIVCRQAILLSHFMTPNVGLIGRYSYPELRDTTRRRFMEVADPRLIKNASIPDQGGGYVDWKCGGTTLFRNLDDPYKYGSFELGYAGIDEVGECPKSVWEFLDGRVGRHWKRQALPAGLPFPYSPLFAAGMPGGHDWLWKLFFDLRSRTCSCRGEEHVRNCPASHHGFRPAPGENEANLPPNYYKNLAQGKAAWWVERFIKGALGQLEGLVWPQFQDNVNVIRDFPIPRVWRRVMGMDHGRRNPTAFQWWAVDGDGNLICYREYELAGPTVQQHAAAMLRADRAEKIEARVADPSIFAKNQSRADKWHSIAEEYAMYGVELVPGDNAMDASLERVGTLLWADPMHKFPTWHPDAGKPGSPRMFFFQSCERSIDCVSSWRFKEFRQEDKGLREEPVDVEDHLCDTARYVATYFPEPTVEARPEPKDPTAGEVQVRRLKRIGRAIRARVREESQPDNEDYA